MAASNNERVSNATEKVSEFGHNLISPKFLMMGGIAASVALIIEGFICFSVCLFNVRSYILSFYYILFGLLTIAAEFKYKFITKHLKIISKHLGRGPWYFFLGTLALGREWWGILIAIILIIFGVLNVCAGLRDVKNDHSNEENEKLDSKTNSKEVSILDNSNVDSKSSVVQLTQSAFNKAYDSPKIVNQVRQNAYDDDY